TEAVVCNVAPGQLYGQLLPDAPPAMRERAANYRYGRGGMQIHFALDSPPDWLTPELRHVPLVHLTESMEQVCASVTEANNGLLPARPTLAIGQPVAVDPTRAPPGGWILWVQMQELPTRIKGDAAGELAAPADGRWNEALREAMADRVQARMERVMPGLSRRIVGRRAYSPADLEGLNCNLVGGDPYSGVCSPDQFFWLRPFAGGHGARGHRTPLRNLFHIGAATHPGPGLGGGSGYLVAQQIGRRGT
ncbi:phytoene desaturase family protein, partial [Achromobacter anxifer]|uniref:phytoene desaturase family protein n=1 Tax=Achromobacter anxifer TaxID=1287737 RepID=UPI0023FA2DB1